MKKMPAAPVATVPVQELKPSPALQIIGKMKATLEGRVVAILVADDSDGATIKELTTAILKAGANVKIVAPKIGGVKLADGTMLPVDKQLAGTPSALFDAVAVVLAEPAAKLLLNESAAVDFVQDAFVHLKAIAFNSGAKALLKKANVEPDAGIIDASAKDAFIAAAKTRQWDREQSVRILA